MVAYFVLQQSDIGLKMKLQDDEDNDAVPYYFVRDETFPHTRYFMRPYPQRKINITITQKESLTTEGGKKIECVFGMMVEKFQVLNSPISCRDPEKVNDIR
ncbi:hypothetical protein PR048_006596, partial [Dryococelus australis]